MSELVTDYLEGEMPLRGRIAVRWHLVLCDGCTAFYDQMRRTRSLLGSVPVPPADEAVEDAILRRLGTEPAAD